MQFTFDDRVDAYRRNVAQALKKVEKREVRGRYQTLIKHEIIQEKEDEVDLMFADMEDEEEIAVDDSVLWPDILISGPSVFTERAQRQKSK